MKRLFYNQCAQVWNEALPLGNGRLGAMVYGGPVCDTFALNEDTLWSGCPTKEEPIQSMADIEAIRELVAAGDYIQAEQKTAQTMHGLRSQAYMPYGKLFAQICAPDYSIKNYRRELDLEQGIAVTSYELNGNRIEKTAFVSLADNIFVLHIQSEQPVTVQFYEAVDLAHSCCGEDGMLTVSGRCPTHVYTPDTIVYDDRESIHFHSALKLLSDKPVLCSGGACMVEKTTQITALFSLSTSFNGFDKLPVSQGKDCRRACREILTAAETIGYPQLLQRHVSAYKKQFDRVSLTLEGDDYDHVPTDERIHRVAAGTVDNKLTELLFDFARYLTIAASQPGTQAMNLQGIWNDRIMPPWHSNYTININTEMNYWHAERCDLPECHMPLLEMLRDFRSRGNVFGLRGWSAWHNTDIWRFHHVANRDPMYAYWPMGGFWLCRHIWEHYLHTGDQAFLKEYYPVMEGAAAFLEDWMYEKDGYLTTCPSTSPENQYRFSGEAIAVCEGSAMDMQIIRDLFDKLIRMGKLLGKETAHYEEILCKLKPVFYGEDGRILEWGRPFEEAELGHRHISHLYGFYPADVLTCREAVEKTLKTRLENGGGQHGWSNAWIANVYARLEDGEAVMRYIQNMFARSIYPNMFDAHPPFQIDGNFGICAAICEALIQDHTGEVKLLPALPKAWKNGEVRNFITRTGKRISFRWKDGVVEDVEYAER